VQGYFLLPGCNENLRPPVPPATASAEQHQPALLATRRLAVTSAVPLSASQTPLKALLAYLDAEALRLVGQLSTSQLAVSAAAAAAAAEARGREAAAATGDAGASPGLPPIAAQPKKRKGLFASMQKLLSLPGSPKARRQGDGSHGSSLGGGSESGTETAAPAAASDASSENGAWDAPPRGRAPGPEQEELWAELARIRWCPVLTAPPVAGLPWPSVAAAGPPLAAPAACRPASDAWLASASCALVGGAPRSAALLGRLGWARPLPGAALGAQLAALGALHSGGPVAPDTARLLAEQVRMADRPWTSATGHGRWVCELSRLRRVNTLRFVANSGLITTGCAQPALIAPALTPCTPSSHLPGPAAVPCDDGGRPRRGGSSSRGRLGPAVHLGWRPLCACRPRGLQGEGCRRPGAACLWAMSPLTYDQSYFSHPSFSRGCQGVPL
jgi:hypothetical protein